MSDPHIQIFCRVRPVKRNSKLQYEQGRYWVSKDEDSSRIGFHIPKDQLQGLVNHTKENFEFKFNHLFDIDSTQEEVFDVVAKPVVRSCLEGYNGTIFAYGQTGSGKTFTITGGAEKYADRGLIPRTLQYIFKQIEQDSQSQYSVHVSYLEIYNEVGYDLLDSSRDAKKLEDLPKVTIQEDSNDYIHLRNLSVVRANSEEEALNLLFVGDTNRMIAETPSNPASSRSHCIFIISLTCRKNGSDVIRRSKLHLVDLAGSERVARTGLDGNLLKEAKHINLSLHYLEQVIIALYEAEKGRRAHVPYRNSMMTSVLRDSLGGNCKTTMIATVAVEDPLIDESISTCRFAQRVALISNHISVNEELDPQLAIARLKQEIERLKAELAIARGEGDSFPDGLPDYERDRIEQAVNGFIFDTSEDAELIFSDFKKIQYAFQVMKKRILNGGGDLVNASTIASTNNGTNDHSEQIEKMKRLAEHRDNEINILVSMIAQLKEQLAAKGIHPNIIKRPIVPNLIARQSSEPILTIKERKPIAIVPRKSAPDLQATKQQFSTEKARAFELFKRSYPASEWIDSQKQTLKVKYTEAKRLGEQAHSLRNEMKQIKEQLADPDFPNANIQRQKLPTMVTEYKQSYQKLKDLKAEIEHLQHLLEQGRIRMTRDFEPWFVEVYQEAEEVPAYQPEKYSPLERPAITRELTQDSVPNISELLQHEDSGIRNPLSSYQNAWNSFEEPPIQSSPAPVILDTISSHQERIAPIIPEPLLKNSFRTTDTDFDRTRTISKDRTSTSTSTFVTDTSNRTYTTTQQHMDQKHSIPHPILERVSSRLSNRSIDRPSSVQSNREPKKIREDIQAFYQARQDIMNRFAKPSVQ